ncbi:TetR/AcrR family transcriptional regulator [Pelagicoccus mobilis]|uniref:TetR/AcrR family transcriptional regulator n=1 Tax=Pelagicoccus mobilis TaxID=415221 RepID=A0A934VTI8_9BACT|nr:TetR/AcrR family transcriptional regulator [Pelagicoccus mobilis]MBK1880115.1 TetR/AcrR family transcriptional regulator [Pelagicoccus mobilis]
MATTDTKGELLDCAQDLIQRVGVNAMSYNDLSVEVGIRKASIHYHFPKKDDLIEALLLRCGNDYSDRYREIASSQKTVLEKLEALADMFDNSLAQGKICLVGMLCVESTTLSDKLQNTLESTINNCIGVIESIFIQGVADQTLPQDMNTNEAAHAFHDTLLGAQIIARSLKSRDHFKIAATTYLNLLRG